MFNLANTEWFFSLIIFVVAYYFSIILNGIIQTWVASNFGDNTAKDLDYGEIHPLVYFSPYEFIILVLFHLGFPLQIPINPQNFNEPKMIRLFVFYLVESFVSLVVAFIALLIPVLIYGSTFVISLAQSMFVSRIAPVHEATIYFPEHSALSIVFALFLIAITYLNIFIAVYSIILHTFKYIIIVGFEKGYNYTDYADYLIFFGSTLIVLLFANPLRYFLLKFIILNVYKITLFLGIQ